MPPVLRSLTQELEKELAGNADEDEDEDEMIESSQGAGLSQEQDPLEALRYDLQVIFKGTTRGVTSVNRSKYIRGVEGIGHHVAFGSMHEVVVSRFTRPRLACRTEGGGRHSRCR
jgi:hypothetical protein